MARVCQVTGKKPVSGHKISHAHNVSKRRFMPNLHRRRFFVESENRWVSLRISNAGLRIIDKLGIEAVLADMRARGEKIWSSSWTFWGVSDMAKAGREKIKLESTAGTGHFYTTTKNKRTTPGKLEITKFDPKARKHVLYKETKIK